MRETVLPILDGCPLLSTDKIRKVNIVQSYIPEQRHARSAHDLIQTLQFPNKKQQDLDNAHAHWDNRPACPHPMLWVLGSDRNLKVCPLKWKRWMRRPFQLKAFVQRSTSVLLRRSFFLYVTSSELRIPMQTSYLFIGSNLLLVHGHTLLRKRSVMLFKLKKKSCPEATLFFHRIFFKQVVAPWQALTRARPWPFTPHPSYPFAAGDSAVGLLCDLCGNSFQGKPGDWRYKQKLPRRVTLTRLSVLCPHSVT